MAEILIQHLNKTFLNGATAIDNVNLDIGDGEFLVLLGPSGCGKTTTLRCIAGLEHQTSGDIRIGERVVNTLHPGERDIAFVFQFYALYPHLTVYDNIAFPLRASGVAKSEISGRVAQVADILRIRHILNKRPKSLPSGEQQRAALGRAIIRRPQAFLMDEPLTNLDAGLRVDMRVELKHLHHTLHTTTVYVTHDQTEAMTMSDRIAVMNQGVLQQVGSPLEVYQHPDTLFVAGFIGDPPMNLIPATLDGDALRMEGGGQVSLPEDIARQIRAKQSGPDLVFGVRAEDITLATNGASEGADLRALIATREPLGDVTRYSITAGDRIVQITAPPHASYQPGESVGLQFDRSRIRIFDAATERAIA